MADTYSADALRGDVAVPVVTQGEVSVVAEPSPAEVVAEPSKKSSAKSKVLQTLTALGIGATSLLGF